MLVEFFFLVKHIIEHNRKYNYTQMSASHQIILQQISKLYNFITLCKTFTDNTLKKDSSIIIFLKIFF